MPAQPEPARKAPHDREGAGSPPPPSTFMRYAEQAPITMTLARVQYQIATARDGVAVNGPDDHPLVERMRARAARIQKQREKRSWYYQPATDGRRRH